MRFSVAVPRLKKIQPSSRLCKYRRLRRPGGLRREYKKLRSLLPGATRSRQLRKKVGVVEAAYQYICELQTALLDKFSTKGVPEELAGVVRGKVATASDIQALALHLINNSASASNTLMRSPFVSVASLLPSRLLSPSELETSSSASTSRIHSLSDSAESAPSPSTHRLNNTLSDLGSASEMESTPASNSRLECVSSEAASKLNDAASTSTETNKQHRERLSTTRSLEVSCSSSSDDIVSHAFSHSQPTATPKCITLSSSSLQSAMNSMLPSPASHSSTSKSSLFACNPFSSSTSKLIE